MADPISSRAPSPVSVSPRLREHSQLSTQNGLPAFRETLRRVAPSPAPNDAERMLRSMAHNIERGERLINGVIASARHGRAFSNEELIAVQAGVYRYTQELELASKLIEKLTSAVKQTVTSQQ